MKIDKDSTTRIPGEWWTHYSELINIVLSRFMLEVRNLEYEPSPSGKGYHVVVEVFPAVNDETVNMLQWLLGDDHKRVFFNSIRIEDGLKRWDKLFEDSEYVRFEESGGGDAAVQQQGVHR